MNGNTAATDQLAALRRSFDEAFAVPPRLREEGLEHLLLIRVAGEALALKTLHVTGLVRIGRILPIPSRIPELLGITGIRGTLVPVFDLAALLGFHPGERNPAGSRSPAARRRSHSLSTRSKDRLRFRAQASMSTRPPRLASTSRKWRVWNTRCARWRIFRQS